MKAKRSAMAANSGVRSPPHMVLLFLALSVASAIAVVWGIYTLPSEDGPSVAGGAIGAGIAIGILSLGMLYLGVRGWRLARALQRGENVIARWVVSPEDYATFLANNDERNALGPEYQNDWKPRKNAPSGGLEVVFGKDIVMVGAHFFGLANTGMFTFEGVQILPENPLSIEFGTVSATLSHGGSATRVDVNRGVLRIPIGRLARADATRVLDHYKRVDSHEVVVNPDFYLGRKKFGLIAAPVCFLAATLGYALQSYGMGSLEVNLVLMIGGIVAGLGALVLAGIAAYLSAEQYRRR